MAKLASNLTRKFHSLTYTLKRPLTYSKIIIALLFLIILVIIFFSNTSKPKPTTPSQPSVVASRGYCTIGNVLENKSEEEERITLILHTSFDRIKGLTAQLTNWEGPISIAVVFPYYATAQDIYCTTDYLKSLHEFSEMVYRVSAHYIIRGDANCELAETLLKTKNVFNKCTETLTPAPSSVDKLIKYPINFARNYARSMAKTKYILLADMEHFFSTNFEQKMINLAQTALAEDPKTVLVYRIFEVKQEHFQIRESKEGLKKLLETNMARQFHEYFDGHIIPRLVEWVFSPDLGAGNTSIQFYNEYRDIHWEPQFVSLTSIPFHDASFQYPMCDNASLRWEMCRRGYKFAIVNDVFMYHPWRGDDGPNEIMKEARQAVMHSHLKAYRNFKARMDLFFPEMKGICPV